MYKNIKYITKKNKNILQYDTNHFKYIQKVFLGKCTQIKIMFIFIKIKKKL